MKLSVVIPFMASDPEKHDILHRCIDSMRGYDELIVVDNWKEGYAVPINYGMSQATGDFILMSTDDVIWPDISLKALCDPEAVTSPCVNGNMPNPIAGVAFCLPKWVYEKTGGLYEGYRISYFDDDDWIKTLEKHNIPMRGVANINIQHPEGGRTLHTFPDHEQFYKENHDLFIRRWPNA